jgi:D-alanine-D-alanine ligase
MKNIAVVMGGYSSEREISIKSGSIALQFLDQNLFNIYKIVIDNDGWILFHEEQELIIDKKDFSVIHNNLKITFDGVFMAIHGIPGENGELQKYFDKLKIPYTTSGEKAAQLSFDKGACNAFLMNNGIRCAKSIVIEKHQNFNLEKIISQTNLPCFVKPNSNGSSFGISKVNEKESLLEAIEKAFQFDSTIIIESFLDGIEVTCGIHNFEDQLFTFPITEIISENDFFDYQAKYEGKSKEITPANLSIEVTKKVSEQTKKIYQLLNLDGIARIDFIIVNNDPVVIEANTVPGLSKESIIPQQAQSAGISLSKLFNQSVQHIFKK